MPVELTTPETIPATEARTYDEVWLTSLEISAPMNGACQIDATLEKARTLADGTKEAMLGGMVRLRIPNLWEEMTQDEAGVMYVLVNLLKARAGL